MGTGISMVENCRINQDHLCSYTYVNCLRKKDFFVAETQNHVKIQTSALLQFMYILNFGHSLATNKHK